MLNVLDTARYTIPDPTSDENRVSRCGGHGGKKYRKRSGIFVDVFEVLKLKVKATSGLYL